MWPPTQLYFLKEKGSEVSLEATPKASLWENKDSYHIRGYVQLLES